MYILSHARASVVALVSIRVGAGANFQRFVVDLLPGAVFLLPRYELVEGARRARARARGLEVARADEAVLFAMDQDGPPAGVVPREADRQRLGKAASARVDPMNTLAWRFSGWWVGRW